MPPWLFLISAIASVILVVSSVEIIDRQSYSQTLSLVLSSVEIMLKA